MADLKKILTELSERENEARIIPESADPRVRAGVEAVQRNAVAAVKRLEDEYKEAVMEHVVIIAVSGPGSKRFAELANKVKCVDIDYTLVKQKFADKLRSRNSGPIFDQHVYFMFLDELNRVKLEYNMLRLPQPTSVGWNEGVMGQPLDTALDRLIGKNYNYSLYSAVTRREIGSAALTAKFSGKKIPVVLYNYSGGIDTQFLPNPVTVLEVNEDISERTVKQMLNEIKALTRGDLKNKSETAPEEVSNEQ